MDKVQLVFYIYNSGSVININQLLTVPLQNKDTSFPAGSFTCQFLTPPPTVMYYGYRLGIKFEKIPPSYFHLSEGKARHLALLVTSSWNSTIGVLKSLFKGKDWSLYSKVSNTVVYSLSCLQIKYQFSEINYLFFVVIYFISSTVDH